MHHQVESRYSSSLYLDGFSRMYMLEPPDFFRTDFATGVFAPHFCGEKCPEKSSRKSPPKTSKTYTTKIPETFLQSGWATLLRKCSGQWSLEEPPISFFLTEGAIEVAGSSHDKAFTTGNAANHVSNGILMRTRQKQKCATLV